MRIKALPGLQKPIFQEHLSNFFPIVSRGLHFVWSFVWSLSLSFKYDLLDLSIVSR